MRTNCWHPIFIGLLILVCSLSHAAGRAVGAGASFPAPVYQNWAAIFEASQNGAIAYDSVGSGEGIKRISERSVDFGASDTALSAEELKRLGLIQIPTLIGGIVPIVNLPGVAPWSLRLTGNILAKIYLGKINYWNDAEIKTVNPNLILPRLPISRVVRSDASGSTKTFTAYLSSVSSHWATSVGSSSALTWPTEVLPAKGSEGMRDATIKTPGALGYIGYNYVVKDRLSGVQLKNRSGRYVIASEEAFAEAVEVCGMHNSVSAQVSLINQEGNATWPITETTYVLFERSPKDPERAKLALRFFYWAFQRGDEMARNTGFIPLPTRFQVRAISLFSQVRDSRGAPLNFF